MESAMPAPILHLARLVLEAATPLSIGTGHAEGVFDTALVRDANGLPAIPGTSLAGVLRHLWQDEHGDADSLFGFQQGERGAPSRVHLSWGALLDSRGRPTEGLLTPERLQDPLYAAVLEQADSPVLRDRVRLTHRGAAADKGKFDRSVLPAGHRFALELRLWSHDEDDPRWDKLLGLFAHPLFRLGGATRAGLGAMRLVSCHQRRFDLRQAQDVQAFRDLGRGLAHTHGLSPVEPTPPARDRLLTGTLHLRPRGGWRIGQGNRSLHRDAQGLKAADLLPKTEERITWETGVGERRAGLCLLPASALKGALAHRMAFHAHRFQGRWAEEAEGEDDGRPPEVDALLGRVKDEGGGWAGALFLDDVSFTIAPEQVGRLMHNAIDRFTGGVRNRVLYEEECLYGGELAVPLTLDLGRIPEERQEDVRRAFKAALDDLCQGRLALGSRTTTGHGFFQGRLQGPLAQWLQKERDTEAAA